MPEISGYRYNLGAPKDTNQSKIRKLDQQLNNTQAKINSVNLNIDTAKLTASALQFVRAAADSSKYFKVTGQLSMEIDNLSVNALNDKDLVGFSYTDANNANYDALGTGATVTHIRITNTTSNQMLTIDKATYSDLNGFVAQITASNNFVANAGNSNTANGVTTITDLKFADGNIKVEFSADGLSYTTNNSVTTMTQLFNTLGITSTNSVTLNDGVPKPDGSGYIVQPGTLIGLEPNNTFKIPGFNAVRFQALRSGTFSITCDNVVENITKVLEKYSDVLVAGKEYRAESGKFSSAFNNVGSKNLTYLNTNSQNVTKNAYAFGLTITDNGIQIDENKFEAAIQEDYVAASNFFNALFQELRSASNTLVNEMNSYKDSLDKKSDEIQTKIDHIISKAEEEQRKADELEKTLEKMQKDFENQMKMLSKMFGFGD